MTQTDTATQIPQWHHPHFVSADPKGDEYTSYRFKPFTGDEPEPDLPASVADAFYEACKAHDFGTPGRAAARQAWSAAEHEARAANELWQVARYSRRYIGMLQQVAPLVAAFQAAKQRAVDTYESLHATPDGFWLAKLLTLAEQRAAALDAARTLDGQSGGLTKAYDGLPERVLEMLPSHVELEEAAGVDLGDWHPQEWYSDGDGPDVSALRELFAEQDERIATVARLFGLEGQR